MLYIVPGVNAGVNNEEQIITDYPIDGAMGSSGRGRVRKLSVDCLHTSAIVSRGILVTILHYGTPEPHTSSIYIVSSAETSVQYNFQHLKIFVNRC